MRTATIEHVVCDQGNGGAYCGNCQTHLGSDPMNLPRVCPNCQATLVGSGSVYIQTGGSDF